MNNSPSLFFPVPAEPASNSNLTRRSEQIATFTRLELPDHDKSFLLAREIELLRLCMVFCICWRPKL